CRQGRGDAEAIRDERARRHRGRRLRLALLRARRRSLLGAGSSRPARRRAGLRACALSVGRVMRRVVHEGGCRMKSAAAAFAFLLCLVPIVQAQESMPENERGRYTFKEISNELLRLDSHTGEVAQCSKRAVGWACQALPEDRTALESEIARLQNENAALKRELVARGLPLPDGIKAPPAGKSDSDLKLPSDADLDRAMSFLERAWRRLVDMVQNLQREMESEKGKKQLEKGGPDKKS